MVTKRVGHGEVLRGARGTARVVGASVNQELLDQGAYPHEGRHARGFGRLGLALLGSQKLVVLGPALRRPEFPKVNILPLDADDGEILGPVVSMLRWRSAMRNGHSASFLPKSSTWYYIPGF
jgi:hypothetical protein